MRLNSTFLKLGVFVAFAMQTAFGLYAQQPPAAALEPEPGLISRDGAKSDTNAPPAEKEDEPAPKRFREIVKVGNDAVLKEGEASKDVVVVRGSATIDGSIEGDLVVVAGSAMVNGNVSGNMVVVLGSAKLGPKAKVEGDAVVVGGTLDADPDAKIEGERVEVGGMNIPGLNPLTDWLKSGLFLARPLPPHLAWVWGIAALFFLLNVLLSVMFPRPTQACTEQMDKSPIGSFFTGFLALILFLPLLILLVATGVGVLIVPFLFCAMIVAFLFGKVAVYRYAGQQVTRSMNSAFVQSPLITLLVGTAVFYVLYMIPVVGFAVWGVAGLWGVGAVLMAVVGRFRRERQEPNSTFSVASGEGTMAMGTAEQGGIPSEVGLETSLPRVGFWLRFMATVLDLLLVGTIFAWMHLPRMFLIFWGIYHITFWTWRGTTIGGIVMGIKVVRMDGRPLNFAVALIRSLSSVFSAMVLFLGFFWAGWSRERQSWHDKIAGTIVVKVPKGMSLV
jgi:hypothetical protein